MAQLRTRRATCGAGRRRHTALVAPRVAGAGRPGASIPRRQRIAHPLWVARHQRAQHRAGARQAHPRRRFSPGSARRRRRCAAVDRSERLRSPRARLGPELQRRVDSGSRVYFPGAGGKIFFRDNVDSASGAAGSAVFYGTDAYDAARATYDANVIINTPLTVDPRGNVFFGFLVTGPTPLGLASGIARVAPDGSGSGSACARRPATRRSSRSRPTARRRCRRICRRSTSRSTRSPRRAARPTGMLLALDSRTLATRGRRAARSGHRRLRLGQRQRQLVAVGRARRRRVLRCARVEHARAQLPRLAPALRRDPAQAKLPGSFGWDQTVSFAPSSMLPQYSGTSTYLVVSKYNNYYGVGTGTGRNEMAILDPAQGQADPITARSSSCARC